MMQRSKHFSSYQSRRTFLKLSALLSGATLAQPLNALSISDPWQLRKGTSQKVLILGAGAAGMSAAIELRALGHEVKVLEGQTRAGGRIRTQRDGFADGHYADMGAARIPEDHDWTMKYIKKYGLELHPFNPTSGKYIHMMQGKRISYDAGTSAKLEEYSVQLTSKEIEMGWAGISAQPFAELMSQAGDPRELSWPPKAIASADQYSFKEYLELKGYSKAIADVLMVGWETKGGMDMSMLELIRELNLSFGATRNKIVGGNDLLPTKMAEELRGLIQYGTKVLEIEQSDAGVEVFVSRSGERSTLKADRVICTFPLTIVRRMGFIKKLSPQKQRAIRDLSYWDLSRTVMQVSDRYWRKEGFNGFAATDLPSETWDPNYEIDSTRGLIAAYLKHDDSQKIANWSDDERLQYSAKHINTVFPGLYPYLEGGYTKCWKEDPWAQGAHAIGTRGQMTGVLPHLIKPEGRIHFAGEHASAYHGWIQGAIESGNRCAKEVNSY